MLLLKLTLVILLSEIAERTMCSDSGPASSANEGENVPKTWPPGSLLDGPSSDGCNYKALPYFEGDEETGIADSGVLALNCTKSCPDEKREKVTDGNPCVVTVQFLGNDEVNVTVGSCGDGSCKPKSPPKYLIVTLMEEGEEEEEDGDEEGEEEEAEEEKEEEEEEGEEEEEEE
uniref:Evasin n=1 Tax=Ixodes ricinus TaxID=34613 RepID=A0A0K8RH52_IXORI